MRGKQLFKGVLIVLLLAWGCIALWPTYKYYTLTPEEEILLKEEGKYKELQKKSIRLGLDLQGGMYLVYEIDLPELFEQKANNKDNRFEELFNHARSQTTVNSEDFATILKTTFQEANIPMHRYWGERGDTDDKVINKLQDEAKDAINRAIEKLRNRIDQFGVSEPTIQKVRGTRILIELPGVKDEEAAKDLIGRTALLEFKLLKDPEAFTSVMEKIDKILAKEKGSLSKAEIADLDSSVTDTTKTPSPGDSEDEAISINELLGITETEESETDSVVVDRNIVKKNPFLSLFKGARQLGKPVTASVENIIVIDKILAREDIQLYIPNDAEFLWGSETFKLEDNKLYRELFLVKKNTELTGEYLTDARVTIGSDVQSAGLPVVNFSLNRNGARIFSRVTGANIDKQLAIILDDKVRSAPRIQTKIPDGRGIITGIESMEEAKMMAIVLRVGALPAKLSVMEERTVGPSLGRDSITRGSISALVGFALVVLLMLIYYRLAGLIANIALILNLGLLMAILVQFGFSLTLPGVAGIVLTIGMAVDANVLVFERIREELATGKTVRAGIDAGYGRAFKTILDANITTLITAVVLYQFGSGPIKGFAVTLSIGILVSMFTALVVTRFIFTEITSRKTLKKLSFAQFFKTPDINFPGHRRIAYLLSVALIVIGFISLGLHKGPNYGIDFKGGTSVVLKFEEGIAPSDIRDVLSTIGMENSEIKQFGNSTQEYLIYLEQQEGVTSEELVRQVENSMSSNIPENAFERLKVDTVGPKIGAELRTNAIKAILIALGLILAYISIRFEFIFAIGAIVALFHDVLITLGIFSLIDFEISLKEIAAFLTIVGYSLNDTIVVYDRIRENLKVLRDENLASIMRKSINQVLSRTVITSLTTFLVVFILFLKGGEVIKGFAFAMLIGVIVGTYSSIFVASPLILEWQRRHGGKGSLRMSKKRK